MLGMGQHSCPTSRDSHFWSSPVAELPYLAHHNCLSCFPTTSAEFRAWLPYGAVATISVLRKPASTAIRCATISLSSTTSHSGGGSCASKFMIHPVIISGPSGCGKSTILARAFKEHPNAFAFSISHTTRGPRNGEADGEHYHFVSKEKMREMINSGEFFEHAEFGGNYYGTSKRAVTDIQSTGRICILDVELQGVKNFKRSSVRAKYILIKPPSSQALEQRLRQRGTETEDSISRRLQRAEQDDDAIKSEPGLFDYVIVNDDLEKAYYEFKAAISEELDLFQGFKHPNKNGKA